MSENSIYVSIQTIFKNHKTILFNRNNYHSKTPSSTHRTSFTISRSTPHNQLAIQNPPTPIRRHTQIHNPPRETDGVPKPALSPFNLTLLDKWVGKYRNVYTRRLAAPALWLGKLSRILRRTGLNPGPGVNPEVAIAVSASETSPTHNWIIARLLTFSLL